MALDLHRNLDWALQQTCPTCATRWSHPARRPEMRGGCWRRAVSTLEPPIEETIAAIDGYSQKVGQLLSRHGIRDFKTTGDRSVYHAIEQMVKNNIGSLIVVSEASGTLEGIITERDYMARVILQSRASKSTRIDQIMTRNVVTCGPSSSVGEALQIMSKHSIRHVPVVDSDFGAPEVVGVLSVRDIVNQIAHDHVNHVRHLQLQIQKLAVVAGTQESAAHRKWPWSLSGR